MTQYLHIYKSVYVMNTVIQLKATLKRLNIIYVKGGGQKEIATNVTSPNSNLTTRSTHPMPPVQFWPDNILLKRQFL